MPLHPDYFAVNVTLPRASQTRLGPCELRPDPGSPSFPMASTTTRGAHYLILLLSVPLLYFICQSILPKRSTRDQQPLDRADLSTGTDAAALDGAGADPVVKQPVRTPRVKRPAPPAPRAEATDGEDEEAPAKKGTGRSGSLQGRLANGALQQLRSKFNFKVCTWWTLPVLLSSG